MHKRNQVIIEGLLIYSVIKDPQWYKVQVSDTTMPL